MVLFKHGFVFASVLDPQYLKRKMAKLGNASNTDKIGRFIAENMGGAGGECIITYSIELYCSANILVHNISSLSSRSPSITDNIACIMHSSLWTGQKKGRSWEYLQL